MSPPGRAGWAKEYQEMEALAYQSKDHVAM